MQCQQTRHSTSRFAGQPTSALHCGRNISPSPQRPAHHAAHVLVGVALAAPPEAGAVTGTTAAPAATTGASTPTAGAAVTGAATAAPPCADAAAVVVLTPDWSAEARPAPTAAPARAPAGGGAKPPIVACPDAAAPSAALPGAAAPAPPCAPPCARAASSRSALDIAPKLASYIRPHGMSHQLRPAAQTLMSTVPPVRRKSTDAKP